MKNDFHDHLDAARLWWALDEAVLEAIAIGPSTKGPYGSTARYVLALKRASRSREGVDDTASLMKIALRLANTPEIAAERAAPPVRRPALRAIGIAALVTLVLAALLFAAAAANVIPLPQPVRDMFRKIGMDTDAAGATRRLEETDEAPRPPHQHDRPNPVTARGSLGLEASESSNDIEGGGIAPSPANSLAPPATPQAKATGDVDRAPKPKDTPAPNKTEVSDDKKHKQERDRKRDEDGGWGRAGDDGE